MEYWSVWYYVPASAHVEPEHRILVEQKTSHQSRHSGSPCLVLEIDVSGPNTQVERSSLCGVQQEKGTGRGIKGTYCTSICQRSLPPIFAPVVEE